MSKEGIEELIDDIKREIKCIEQYRVLTNKFVNENVSQYNIDKFKEEQYIENFEKYEDYEYDIYNWVYIKNFKDIVELAEILQQRIDKAIELCNIVIKNEPLQAIPNEELLDQVCAIKTILQDEEVK